MTVPSTNQHSSMLHHLTPTSFFLSLFFLLPFFLCMFYFLSIYLSIYLSNFFYFLFFFFLSFLLLVFLGGRVDAVHQNSPVAAESSAAELSSEQIINQVTRWWPKKQYQQSIGMTTTATFSSGNIIMSSKTEVLKVKHSISIIAASVLLNDYLLTLLRTRIRSTNTSW